MAKICWICRNTEDYFLNQKKELLEKIETQIADCESFAANIINETKEKLGFSDLEKKTVKSIKTAIMEMTFNAVFENRNSFLQLEPNLSILFNYFDKYYKHNSAFKTVKDVADIFIQEPIEQRYRFELNANNQKITELESKKKTLERITTFFIEKEITSASIDEIKNKLNYKSRETRQPVSFGFNRFSENTIQKEEKEFDFSFSRLGFDIHRKIYLCPICMSLLGESALASFEIKEAQKRALESALDDDWGDEDEF